MEATWLSPAAEGFPSLQCGGFSRLLIPRCGSSSPHPGLWGGSADRIQPCPSVPQPRALLAMAITLSPFFCLEVLSRDLVAQIQAAPVRHPGWGGTGWAFSHQVWPQLRPGLCANIYVPIHPRSIAPGGQPSPGGSRLGAGDLWVQDMGPLGTSVQEEPIQGIQFR